MIKSIKIFLLAVLAIVVLYSIYEVVISRNEETINEISEPSKLEGQTKSHKSNTTVENSEIEVDNLNFNSKTHRNQNYNIKAEKSIKNKSGMYFMNNVWAGVYLDKDKEIIFSSTNGAFDENLNYLKLTRDIVGRYMEFKLQSDELELFIDDEEILSRSPVILSSPKMKIKGDNLHIKENIIVIEGNVKTCIYSN